jgi:hypothetical protein
LERRQSIAHRAAPPVALKIPNATANRHTADYRDRNGYLCMASQKVPYAGIAALQKLRRKRSAVMWSANCDQAVDWARAIRFRANELREPLGSPDYESSHAVRDDVGLRDRNASGPIVGKRQLDLSQDTRRIVRET